MTWPPKFEDSIALSPKVRGKWEFMKDMKVGQSFKVETSDMASAAVKYGRRLKFQLSRAKVEGGFRVWRTA